jgi:uncharacterized protein DUF2283
VSAPCQKIVVAKEVCYLRFADGKPDHTNELPYRTARGEMMIADFDADGRILGIELVGSGKPCQE